jgi:hypothetical protein
VTNALDALRALGVLGEDWRFASGNWAFLVKTTAIHATPVPLVAVLFAGVIAWEGLAAALMWRALSHLARPAGRRAAGAVHAAFGAGLALFAAFVIADEIFIAYQVEGVHLRVLVALLGSLLVVQLLPADPGDDGVNAP